MNPRTDAILALIALTWLASCGEPPVPERDTVPAPTNVVLIVVDTLRSDAILDPDGTLRVPGLANYQDRVATFPRCYSHASLTRPSHASLFTSRMPSEARVVGNHDFLPEDMPVLAEWLHEQGFQTLAASSFWLTGADEGRIKEPGLMRGFEQIEGPHAPLRWSEETLDTVRKLLKKADPSRPLFLFCHFVDPHYPYRTQRGEPFEVALRYEDELSETLTASNTAYLTRTIEVPPGEHTLSFRADAEFTLLHFEVFGDRDKVDWGFTRGNVGEKDSEFVVRLNNPNDRAFHRTIQFCAYDAPDIPTSRERYAEEVERMDRTLAAFFELLDERGILDEGLVVLTSDHGEALGEHGILQHASNLYDELVHVPLVVKPPRSNPHLLADLRARSGEMVGIIDVTPTILDILRVPALPGQRGQSILEHQPGLYLAEGHPPYADHLQISVRDDRYKLIYHPEEDRYFMYDLLEDPHEEHDLWAEHPGMRSEWAALLREKATQLASSQPIETIDPALRRDLEALGYLGGEPEDE